MTTKLLLPFIALIILTVAKSTGQEFASDKESWIISGLGSFSEHSGDLFEGYDGEKITSINLSLSANYFFKRGLFCGLGSDFSHQKIAETNVYSVAVGPNFGYMYGSKNARILPFIHFGYRWNKISVEEEYPQPNMEDNFLSGPSYSISTGIIIPVQDHIGITMELGYTSYNLPHIDRDIKGYVLSFAVGLSGLIF